MTESQQYKCDRRTNARGRAMLPDLIFYPFTRLTSYKIYPFHCRHPPQKAASYQPLETMLNIIFYVIAQIFSAKTDVPNHNVNYGIILKNEVA